MRLIFLALFTLTLLPSTAFSKTVTIGGVTLGADVKQFIKYTKPDTDTALRDRLYLNEVSIKPDSIKGIRGGSIGYGNCKNPGKVMVLKLKFKDKHKECYDQLLELYKKKLGDPDKWLGDPFHTVLAWLWNLDDGEGGNIEVILMYSKTEDLRPGVSIKATYRSLMAEEAECYAKTHPRTKTTKENWKSLDLNQFVPH